MKGYTIQHSIDLLEKKVKAGGSGGSTAADITYDNTSSHMTADDVQKAIDELNTAIGQIDTRDNYSETETNIGKWINDAPLYRKVLSLGALPNNTTSSVPHGITNLGQFVSIKGIANAANGSAVPLPFVDDSSKNADILIDAGTENVRVITKSNKSVYTGYAILEYTKVVTNTRSKKK